MANLTPITERTELTGTGFAHPAGEGNFSVALPSSRIDSSVSEQFQLHTFPPGDRHFTDDRHRSPLSARFSRDAGKRPARSVTPPREDTDEDNDGDSFYVPRPPPSRPSGGDSSSMVPTDVPVVVNTQALMPSSNVPTQPLNLHKTTAPLPNFSFPSAPAVQSAPAAAPAANNYIWHGAAPYFPVQQPVHVRPPPPPIPQRPVMPAVQPYAAQAIPPFFPQPMPQAAQPFLQQQPGFVPFGGAIQPPIVPRQIVHTALANAVPIFGDVNSEGREVTFGHWNEAMTMTLQCYGLYGHVADPLPPGAPWDPLNAPTSAPPPLNPWTATAAEQAYHDTWWGNDHQVSLAIIARLSSTYAAMLPRMPQRTSRDIYTYIRTTWGDGNYNLNQQHLNEVMQLVCSANDVAGFCTAFHLRLGPLVSARFEGLSARQILLHFVSCLPASYAHVQHRVGGSIRQILASEQDFAGLFREIEQVKQMAVMSSRSRQVPHSQGGSSNRQNRAPNTPRQRQRENSYKCTYEKCGLSGHTIEYCKRRKEDMEKDALPGSAGKSKSSSSSQPTNQPRVPHTARANMATAVGDTPSSDPPDEGKSPSPSAPSFAVSFAESHFPQTDDVTSPFGLALGEDAGEGFSALGRATYTLPSLATFVSAVTSSNEIPRLCADLYRPCDVPSNRPAELPAHDIFSRSSQAFCFMATPDIPSKFTPRLRARVANIFNALLDSGTTHHIIRSRAAFCSRYDTSGALPIKTANCGYLLTYAIGDVSFDVIFKGQTVRLTLRDCLHAPDAPIDLISVCRLVDRGVSVHFDPPPAGTTIAFPSDHPTIPGLTLQATQVDGLSFLSIPFITGAVTAPCSSPIVSVPSSSPTDATIAVGPAALYSQQRNLPHERVPTVTPTPDVWHRRLAHVGLDTVKDALTKDYGKNVHYVGEFSRDKCGSCIIAKQPQRPFPSSDSRSDRVGRLLHMDTTGPYTPPLSVHGEKYLHLIMDDCSHFLFPAIIKLRPDCLDNVKFTVNSLERETGALVDTVRCDGAREFVLGTMGKWFHSKGIKVQQTAPYSHQQNGRIERQFRIIDDCSQAVMLESGLPSTYRKYAMLYVVWTRNRLPTSTLPAGVTPYEKLKGEKPDYSQAKIFGCYCYVMHPKELRKKGSLHSFKAIFVGYVENHKGWLTVDLLGNEHYSREVEFNELSPGRLGVPRSVKSSSAGPQSADSVSSLPPITVGEVLDLAAERRRSLRSAKSNFLSTVLHGGGASGVVDVALMLVNTAHDGGASTSRADVQLPYDGGVASGKHVSA